MIIFYAAILLLVISGISLRNEKSLTAALDQTQANVIKGIFILLVFIRHILAYIRNAGYCFHGIEDQSLIILDSRLGQAIVAMFLLYSGYGIHRQILKYDMAYVDKMPRHRLLNTLLNFDVAVFVYMIIAFVMEKRFTLSHLLLSFLGWEKIGNSNWYIFAIIILYGLVYVAHKCFRSKTAQRTAFSVLLLFFTVVMCLTRPRWWSDSLFCFGGGYFLSCFREKCGAFFERHWRCIGSCGFAVYLLCGAVYFVSLNAKGRAMTVLTCPCFWLNIMNLAFAAMILALFVRFNCRSRCLEWFGKHLFPLFIYQNVPMMLIPASFISLHPFGYVVICFGITVVIAKFYKYWQIKL